MASPETFSTDASKNPKVKAMMAAWGLHLDFAPDVAGGALFPYLECMVNQSFGMVIGQGCADTIVKAMVGVLQIQRGGELLLFFGESVVKRVELTGFMLADGSDLWRAEEQSTPRPSSPTSTRDRFRFDLVPSQRFPRKIRARSPGGLRAGPGTMMVHLALDDLPGLAR